MSIRRECTHAVAIILLTAVATGQQPSPQGHVDATLPAIAEVRKVKFALDGVPATVGEITDMLRYRVVAAEAWQHGYSHVAGMDRSGTLTLRDDRVLRWMLRPGGLGTLTFPDGSVLHLACDSGRTADAVQPPAGIEVAYEGMSTLLEQATAGDADRRLAAVQQLACLQDNREGRALLLRLVVDPRVAATIRDRAAMGLGNYCSAILAEDRQPIVAALLEVLAREQGAAPTGIALALLRFGAGTKARAALGRDLREHPFEIELLAADADDPCRSRLWEMTQNVGRPGNTERFTLLARLSQAQIAAGDTRGVGLGMELLRNRAVMMPVYGHNVFSHLATVIGGEFVAAVRTAPSEADIERMLTWWDEHQATLTLPAAR